MHACSASMLLLLHSTFMLSPVKMLLKGEVGGCALNSHGNYIVDHGKSWKNHGIVFLNFCGNPVHIFRCTSDYISSWEQTIWTQIRLLRRQFMHMQMTKIMTGENFQSIYGNTCSYTAYTLCFKYIIKDRLLNTLFKAYLLLVNDYYIFFTPC